MNLFQKWIAPMLSRLLAAGLVAISPWLSENLGITLDEETQRTLVALGGGLVLYLVTHVLGSRFTNPDDIAKPHPESVPTNPVAVPRVPTGLVEEEGQ